jgi:hypothetical protein
MTKEFVPYELAVKLKELGFDEPCLKSYGDDGLLNQNDHSLYLSAPTFSQAFRWLYQKLNIDKGIMPLDVESQHLLLNELLDKLSSKHLLV